MTFTYKYPRPSVTTDAIIIAKEKDQHFILLIERGNEPYKNMWALPGGFIEMDEDLIDACKRELREETGIEKVKLKEFATFGKPEIRGGVQFRLYFGGLLKTSLPLMPAMMQQMLSGST